MAMKTRSMKSWQAAKSIIRIQSDDITAEEERLLLNSYENDEEFRNDFLLINQGLARIEGLADDPDVLSVLDEAEKDIEKSRGRWALVAGLIIAISTSILMLTGVVKEDEGSSDIKRYVTRTGEQKTIKLIDGSVITMNTATQLLVDINSDSRSVTLVRGEAYFDVEKDPMKPFSVKAGNYALTVLGTEFNVMRSTDELTLAVTEGVVGIHDPNEPLVKSPLSLDDSNEKVIEWVDPEQRSVTAGWVVNIDESKDCLIAYQADNIEHISQWRTGLLRFEGVPLGEVVKQINRYSAKKILIEDPNIMSIEIFGSVQVNSLGAALRGLEKSYPVKVRHQFDSISLTGK